MLFGRNRTATDGQGQIPELSDASNNPERRAKAWLENRLARGAKERFVEIVHSFTPEMGAACLTKNVGHNRKFNDGSAALWARIMQEGRWKLTHEAIAFTLQRMAIFSTDSIAAVASKRLA